MQSGNIVVYSLRTYQQKAVIKGHNGSVLGLCLAPGLLISSASDRVVNIWRTRDWKRQWSLHSPYDMGDVFCVAFSQSLHTVYMGCQNTMIQWCNLAGSRQTQPRAARPVDGFFNSTGPGQLKPRPSRSNLVPEHARGGEIIDIAKENVRQFAHHGFVYCMQLVGDGIPEFAGQEVLVSAGGDGSVKFWRLASDRDGAIEELYQLPDDREEGHSVFSLAIDGTFLYAGRMDGEVDVWDLETRQLVRNIRAHSSHVLSLSVGEGYIFSASATGYVCKFDRQHGLQSRWQAHDGRSLSTAVTLNRGRLVFVTGGSDCTLAVWDAGDGVASKRLSTKTSNEKLLELLGRFISYRTVSSDERCQVDCRRGASFLRSVFKSFGATTEMMPAPNSRNPVIVATFKGNPATAGERKRIMFYGHYDVVAAENASGNWSTDPFVMSGIDGYLYGRGASDNKGPIMAAIFACAELASEQELGSDIVFIVEGEEECGSRGFEDAIRAGKDRIGNVDWILLANSYWLDDGIPCLTYGLRGVIHATVQIESGSADLHSGVDGSSQADESLKDLVMLLGKLTGKHGEVKLPGFYDPIPDLTAEEGALYKDITAALIQHNPKSGNPDTLANSLMRRWREPNLTIHRFETSGSTNTSIIPRLAKAALSLRLVPNQECDVVARSLKEYLCSEFAALGSRNSLQVTIDHAAEPWLGDWRNQVFQTLDGAIGEVWGCNGQNTRPLYIREGGSIPAIRFLEKEFNAPAAQLPCGQATDSAHLHNERLRLINLYNSKEIFKRVFRELPVR
ncbi:beta-Ala-His dipeptidase [Piedraia hortae CBS 480.64]|uniref:Beta-Ala-His dipeptidase n=1 Tax=Piedraia hortae CBS 480.64 TaxID=1314780 RepID=A0A6A7BZP5_9PEZI|nr:beta-Ala-His dipeptidase [Piedraia hortae CBS 480.64]